MLFLSQNILAALYKLSMRYRGTFLHINLRGLLAILPLLLLFASLSAQTGNPDKGKDLFKANCAACHNKNMKDKMTGPALGTVLDDWAPYPRKDLHDWIRNSQAMIAAGHPKAVELWNQYKPVVMTPFTSLSDQDMDDLLAYIDGVAKGTYGKAAPVAGTEVQSEEPANKSWMYWVLFAVFAIIALVLSNIIFNLRKISSSQEGKTIKDRTLKSVLTSKGVLGVVILALIALGSFTTVHNAINFGRQQNYQPTQPINFSHKIHAGDNKIDCKFCHDGARRSKQSIIPGTSTCMSCHKAVKKGTLSGTAEITKIYASNGFNPMTDSYIDNYMSMSDKDAGKIYKKWIAQQYRSENDGVSTADAEAFAKDQWNDIVNSMTSETKASVKGPIEWIRIHNLPDFVYFNHSQHVTVGQIACQKCHGKVEEMDVVRQYSTLSMGWCINCHRETDVKFTENPYYDSYVNYHKEMKEGKRTSVTVEDIGGLECQKCHY